MIRALTNWLSTRAKKRRDQHLAEVFDRCFVQPYRRQAETCRDMHVRGVKAAFEMQKAAVHAALERAVSR